jgi:nuclear pore complex protein Nup93
MTKIFHILSKVTAEPPALPPVEHAGAHILNAPLFEQKYARVYFGDQESHDAVALRQQIAKGAQEALEEQYWDVLERTVQEHPNTGCRAQYLVSNYVEKIQKLIRLNL